MRYSDLSRARQLAELLLAAATSVVMIGCSSGADTVVNAASASSAGPTAAPSGTTQPTPEVPTEAPATPTAPTAPPAPESPPTTSTPPPVPVIPPPPPSAPVTQQPTVPVTPPAPVSPPAEPAPPVAERPPPVNAAPFISGSPPTAILATVAYSFRPAASDSDGDALTFQISNRPRWATFDTQSGEIRGTPDVAEVGAYNGIVITVSDGHSTAQLPVFGITVSQNQNGAATISWTPPTQNSDGSALTDLAGYSIVYGTDANAMTQVVQINNPGLSSFVVDDLAPGNWVFAVKSVNTAGAESSLSNSATKTIR